MKKKHLRKMLRAAQLELIRERTIHGATRCMRDGAEQKLREAEQKLREAEQKLRYESSGCGATEDLEVYMRSLRTALSSLRQAIDEHLPHYQPEHETGDYEAIVRVAGEELVKLCGSVAAGKTENEPFCLAGLAFIKT